MKKIDTFNLEWDTKELLKNTKALDDEFLSQLYQIPLPELTYEERYRLRELLMMTVVHANALEKEVSYLKDDLAKPLWKRLLNR